MNKAHDPSQQNEPPEQLDRLWDNLLSRRSELIRAAFASLDALAQKAILTHLRHMASESGWQPEQKIAAEAALKALLTQPKQEK